MKGYAGDFAHWSAARLVKKSSRVENNTANGVSDCLSARISAGMAVVQRGI
jgi:hypothetical protein